MGGISGNERVLERLQELLDSGQAVALVGAGASAGLYPLWGQLIRQLADETVARGRAKPEDRDFWLQMASRRPQQAVRAIKEALGDSIYGAVLREIFRPTAGPDGKRYTPIHGALMRMPFRGYVTTNYDPGLVEARHDLRRDVEATGYATWKDPDELQLWYTGDVFAQEQCPILFAHGIYQRSDTIVLGVGEYREAYRPGLYRRTFENLWGRERLVFVGFGFSDSWFDFLADEVITQTAARAAAEPRHIALLGLRDDQPYTPQMRRLFQDQYNAEVYFYPIAITPDGGEDHTALQEVLDKIAGAPPPPGKRPRAPSKRPPQRWVHETTNDDRYVQPGGTLERLDRWADDLQVRCIAVTGLGGQGKTALIGHWLKQQGGDLRRRNRGLLFWSFYADRDVGAFLEALVEFGMNELGLPPPQRKTGAVQAASELLLMVPLLIVLDGLEVLQERPGTVAYGELLADDLRELLAAACRVDHAGLVVLTSRFPFADLTSHLGRGLRALDLDRLSPDEGAALLRRCGVEEGSDEDRRNVSRRLEGHPLALRVFAAALATQADGDPTRLISVVFDESGLSDDVPLERKLRHLLRFYQERLPPQRTLLLGIISLFRVAVPEATIRTLARRLPGVREVLGELRDDALRRELDGLCGDHLVLRDHGAPEGEAYSCHPVMRDHFRAVLLERGDSVASGVADLLGERPSGDRPQDIAELQPVLGAIELLLEAGDFKRADELYRGRLRNGEVFKWLPAPHEGMQCALGFVADQRRRDHCERELSRRRLSYHLNVAGVFALMAGELQHAARFCEDAAEIDRQAGNTKRLSIRLHNYADLLSYLGRLHEAESAAREALALALESRENRQICDSSAQLGYALSLQNRVDEAMDAFHQASAIQTFAELDGLYSGNGTQCAELLVRLGLMDRARELTQANLKICRDYHWGHDVARCEWLLGLLDAAEGALASAGEHLARAEATMRRGHMLQDLPRVLVAWACLHLRAKAWDEGLRAAEEALRLAAPRGMRLAHSDALVVRGRILLERARARRESEGEQARMEMLRAQDDAEGALALARQCGYAWAERDALWLLADTWAALGEADRAVATRRDAEVLARRLQLDRD